jgi:hypothetical protein
MGDDPMVPVLTAGSSFEAKIVAARLGSEGIMWQLRGNVDGPYPGGMVEVLVARDDYDLARELLLVDEVEDALTGGGDDQGGRHVTSRELWFVSIAIVLSALFAVARMIGFG